MAVAPTDLRNEIAGVATDPWHPLYLDIMRPRDSVLQMRSRGRGLEIYDEIARDAHVRAILNKRYASVVARNWEVTPASSSRTDRKAADLVRRVLSGEWGFRYDLVCWDQLSALLKGYACGEIMWGIRDEYIVPLEVRPKDPRRFVFDDACRARLLTRSNMFSGEAVPDKKILIHRFGSDQGDPYGLGLGNNLYWPAYFKRKGITFWLIFCEKFGSPTAVGMYPQTMTEQQQDDLLDTLSDISQQTAVVVPDTVKISLLEATRSGINTYEQLCRYMDEMMTVCILGETLTTSIRGGGSRAASETHNEVREELADFDADMLCASHSSQLAAWITEINFPGAAPPTISRPRPARERDEAQVRQEQIKAQDMALNHVITRRQSGYVPADPNAPIIDQVGGQWLWIGSSSGPRIAPPAITSSDPSVNFVDPAIVVNDAADKISDMLDRAAAPVMGDIVGAIRGAVMSAKSFDDISAALLKLYPKLPTGQLAGALRDAMTMAELMGRSEILSNDR